MNIDYSDTIMEAFHSPQYVYVADEKVDLIGYAGDMAIGEYVQLYFHVQKAANYADNKIMQARFSAIGGVLLISAAEKLCSLLEGLTFEEALKYCDPEIGLPHILEAPNEKIYSINFVTQAFYKAFETLTSHSSIL